jgi:RecA-family ATPase
MDERKEKKSVQDIIDEATRAKRAKEYEAARAKRDRFQLKAFDDIEIDTGPEWLIKEVLPSHGLAVIYGEPGCGKSFLCLDMALAVARGRPWAGRASRQGTIVYITPEGVSGFKKRIVAYRQHHKPPPGTPFYLIDDPVILAPPRVLGATSDVGPLAFRIKEQVETVSAIFVDTLARAMIGADENSTADMGVLIENCTRLAAELECLVVLVHHTGKDSSKGARGSSALKGASDLEMLVSITDGVRNARLTKSKDGEGDLQMDFSLPKVNLGDGVSSCIIGVDRPWSLGPEDPLLGVGGSDILRVQKAIHGKGLRANSQSTDWVGHTIARVLDRDSQSERERAQISKIIKIWLSTGMLTEVTIKDEHRHAKRAIEVGEWADE